MIHIANPYRDYKGNCSCEEYCPVIVAYEQEIFYLNYNNPIEDIDFDDWQVDLIDSDGNILASDVATLYKQVISGDSYNIYGELNIPDLPVGKYKFVIYNSETNKVKYISNCHQLIKEKVDIETTALEYRNDIEIYNYYYEGIPEFFNRIRLHIFRIDIQPETEYSQYREITTGRLNNYRTDADRYMILEAYKFDDNAHEAMYSAMIHNSIYINGKEYIPKSGYTITTDKFRKLNIGNIELLDKEFSETNKKC